MSTPKLSAWQVEKVIEWLTAKYGPHDPKAVDGQVKPVAMLMISAVYPGGLEAFVRDYPEPITEEPTYPCEKCGKLRTKAQGGTTFTVFEECWDLTQPPPSPTALEIVRRIRDIRHPNTPIAFWEKSFAECAALVEDYARREREWKTGIPPVPSGKLRRFWCAIKCGHKSDKIGYCLLEYANAHVMPMSDSCDTVPEDAIPVGDDGEYAWTGWHQESCEHCDTWWQYTGDVLAWMEMPRDFQPTAATGEGEKL